MVDAIFDVRKQTSVHGLAGRLLVKSWENVPELLVPLCIFCGHEYKNLSAQVVLEPRNMQLALFFYSGINNICKRGLKS